MTREPFPRTVEDLIQYAYRFTYHSAEEAEIAIGLARSLEYERYKHRLTQEMWALERRENAS